MAAQAVTPTASADSSNSAQQAKAKAVKVKAPTLPPRPPSPWIIFVSQAIRERGAGARPEDFAGYSSIMAKLGPVWRKMTDAEKQPYVMQSQAMHGPAMALREAFKTTSAAEATAARRAAVLAKEAKRVARLDQRERDDADKAAAAPAIAAAKLARSAERRERKAAAKAERLAWEQRIAATATARAMRVARGMAISARKQAQVDIAKAKAAGVKLGMKNMAAALKAAAAELTPAQGASP